MYGERFDRGNKGFGGGGGGFRNDFRPRERHKATCADCGQECEVPFKPGKDREGNMRPVYCQECYKKHRKF